MLQWLAKGVGRYTFTESHFRRYQVFLTSQFELKWSKFGIVDENQRLGANNDLHFAPKTFPLTNLMPGNGKFWICFCMRCSYNCPILTYI